jgi:hypothetical protein
MTPLAGTGLGLSAEVENVSAQAADVAKNPATIAAMSDDLRMSDLFDERTTPPAHEFV